VNEAKSLTLCWAFCDLLRGDIFMKEVFEFFFRIEKKMYFCVCYSKPKWDARK